MGLKRMACGWSTYGGASFAVLEFGSGHVVAYLIGHVVEDVLTSIDSTRQNS